MRQFRSVFFCLIGGLALCQMALARPKALFYLTEGPRSIQSFLDHASKVDILVPTWYSVDAAGFVWGGPNQLVIEKALQSHVPIMPIVVNPGFNQDNFHKFASSADARSHFIAALIGECKKHGYIGFQFDFENVAWTDQNALTALVTETAQALHKEGLQLSIATVPNAPGYPGQGGFARWIFENWRAAYDLNSLAQQVDLICLMTYDEHTRYTPPGPVAGYPWTLENLEYALQSVPKEKLSLGIPVYGYHWFAGEPGKDDRPSNSADSIGALAVQQLIAAYHPRVQWDPEDRVSWFYFYRDQMREWVFYTDARTFSERYKLAADRQLQGFCSWVLGEEDPAIWDLLPPHP
jgi:spore germination protein YaaH